MKVLHINRYVDGFYQNLMDALSQCDAEQRILIPTTRSAPKWVEKFRPLQPRHPIHRPLRRHFISLRNEDLYKAFSEEIADFSPDIVHAHTAIRGGTLALMIKERLGKKYVVSVRSSDTNQYLIRSSRYRDLFGRVLEGADHIICMNPSIENELYRRIPGCQEGIEGKVSIIGNGIDNFWVQNMRPQRRITAGAIHLVQTGAISSRKNQLTTFKAVELLNSIGVKACISFIGKEKEVRYSSLLKKYVSASRYGDSATFISHQSKEDLVRLYEKADIFVMPSIRETFGISYIEAMSQGLPIVYSKARGVDGFFEGAVGASADPDDPKSVADSVMKVIDQYSKLSANASKEAGRFDWNSVASDVHGIYRAGMAEGKE